MPGFRVQADIRGVVTHEEQPVRNCYALHILKPSLQALGVHDEWIWILEPDCLLYHVRDGGLCWYTR